MYSRNPIVNRLVPALIRMESSGNPNAVSNVGARGLMQLMPDTAKRFGVTNPFDPQQNVAGGTKYLEFLAKRYNNDPKLISGAYHAGEGNMDNWLAGKPSGVGQKTRAYMDKAVRLINATGKQGQGLSDAGFQSYQQRPQPTTQQPKQLPQQPEQPREAAQMVNLSDYYKEPQPIIPVKKEKKAHWQDGLLALGLGMLANNNGSLAGSFGQGGIAALNTMGALQDQDQQQAIQDAKMAQAYQEQAQQAKAQAMQEAQQRALQDIDLSKLNPKELSNQLLKLGMTKEAFDIMQKQSDPYYQVVSTPQGVARFNARTGEMELVNQPNGQPFMKASDDPTLQGSISQAREFGKNAPIIDRTQATEGIKSIYDTQTHSTNAQTDVNLAGSKAFETEAGKGRGEIATGQANAKLLLPQQEMQSDRAIKLIDELKAHPGKSDVVGAPSITGLLKVPGTNAADFNAKLAMAKGQTFLQAYQSLKGSGAITDLEGKKAEEAIAALQAAQSEKAFDESLSDLKQVIENGRISARRKAGINNGINQPAQPEQNKTDQQITSNKGWTVRKVN